MRRPQLMLGLTALVWVLLDVAVLLAARRTGGHWRQAIGSPGSGWRSAKPTCSAKRKARRFPRRFIAKLPFGYALSGSP